MANRWRSESNSGSADWSASPPEMFGALGGSGTRAVYPVASTVAMASSIDTPSGSTTCAFSVA